MQKKTLTISNKLGLHARASMKLVDVASRFQANAAITFEGKQADAKDILQMMSLGAPMGTVIDVTTDGTDEGPSMDAIVTLINNKFGED